MKAFEGIEGVPCGDERHATTGDCASIGTDAYSLFSSGYGFCGRGVCDYSLHLHRHPPASSLSDGSLPLRRDLVSDGPGSIYRRLAYWYPTALALAILVTLDCFWRYDPGRSRDDLTAHRCCSQSFSCLV